MLIHNGPLLRIYFGNANDGLYQKMYYNLPKNKNILRVVPFARLKKTLELKQLFFLKQMHSIDGLVVNQADNYIRKPFHNEGDFILTNSRQLGLGVMTADCLPLIFYDVRNNAIAIAHAGWKGSVQRIAKKVIEQLKENFGTNSSEMRIFFGPSAKSCCYKVNNDFVEQLDDFRFAQQALIEAGDQLFFDLPGFNKLQLEAMGIKKEAIRSDYNVCTICNENYFSYRRQGATAGRQMTVASLK